MARLYCNTLRQIFVFTYACDIMQIGTLYLKEYDVVYTSGRCIDVNAMLYKRLIILCGTEQLQGHTMGNKYKIIIFGLVHCFGEYLGLLSSTSLSS